MTIRWIDPATGQPLAGTPLGMALSAQARATPDRSAMTIGGRSWTFAAFDALANQRAQSFLVKGMVAGDRVILSMPNRVDYLLSAFALWKIGATPCPVSDRLNEEEFRAIVALSGARHAIGPVSLPRSEARLHDVDVPIKATLPDAPLPPIISRPGKIAHSGGSTGRPKLIIDPLPSVWGPDKEGCRRGPRHTLLNPGPLYHSAPFNTTTMAMAQGTHIVCMERFDPVEWLALVEEHRVTYAYLVPTMMTRIARLPEAVTAAADLSSIETLLHMAAPCPPDVKRWWIDRIGADHVWEVYGGTERIGVTTIGGREWLAHPGSVGTAAPGQEIIITGEDGSPLAQGEIGEIRFRKSGGAGKGYAYIGAENRIVADTDSFGDMGWLDKEGYLYIADRRTDMILVGGVNIYPAEIEAAVEMMPGVLCCAVIGLPDADLGNRVHAIVELAPDVSPPEEDGFLARLGEMIGGLKRPRSVEFTTDPIRDQAGKVRRSALRADRMA
ncbi:o-succinylbenzoate--CoA ligase [Sphingobium chlorophenolicum L-1]|uniref:O-succinylbenzoate--CoA ligase n=1 Tax=Sphingobium chlorophenolicum L-1 TaxID=690566 RepID=F6F135_SPHCR|nr:AMP-binding protein [Sphingobium chlorophenolicum]AEG51251.1 o-succinylbenzoate--CoA ligase [Sphingobium chlorophenolicum L-1]